MKPTNKQKAVITAIRQQLGFWEKTNDINSPTHSSDIYEFLSLLEMDEVISMDELKTIEKTTNALWLSIQKLNG